MLVRLSRTQPHSERDDSVRCQPAPETYLLLGTHGASGYVATWASENLWRLFLIRLAYSFMWPHHIVVHDSVHTVGLYEVSGGTLRVPHIIQANHSPVGQCSKKFLKLLIKTAWRLGWGTGALLGLTARPPGPVPGN